MKRLILCFAVLGLLAAAPTALADKLVLKNGKAVSGKLRKVTKTHVYFQTRSGKTYKISRKNIKKFFRSKKGKGPKAMSRPTKAKKRSKKESRSRRSRSGDSPFTLGARINANLNDASVATSLVAPPGGKSMTFAFGFGASANYKLSPSFHLQFEAAYDSFGVTLTDTTSTVPESYTVLEIPIFLNWNVLQGSTPVYISAGGFFGLGLGATRSGSAISTAAGMYFGLLGGAGVQFDLSESMLLDVGARFLFSLMDAETDASETRTLISTQLVLNLMFRI